MTPPSELIRPPSKAAVIFLRWTTGKQNGRRLSSVMAGVACLDPAKGWLQQPNPTPDQKLTLLPPPQIRPRHEYDGLDCCKPSPALRLSTPQAGCRFCLEIPDSLSRARSRKQQLKPAEKWLSCSNR